MTLYNHLSQFIITSIRRHGFFPVERHGFCCDSTLLWNLRKHGGETTWGMEDALDSQ
jgi:hypothetical protein